MQPAACISSRFCPDKANRSRAAGLSLSMENAAHEHLQMRRGEHQKGCERAACHSVGIERIGNGQIERPYRHGDNAFCAPLGKESGWQDLVAIGVSAKHPLGSREQMANYPRPWQT